LKFLFSKNLPALKSALPLAIAAALTAASPAWAGETAKNPAAQIQIAAANNPCAAKNPCNPCATKNPLNPCSPGHIKAPDADLTLAPAAAEKVYKRLKKDMAMAFALSGQASIKRYQTWQRYNKTPYQSTQHGDRYLNNYGNKAAKAYGQFEKSGKMPVGAVLAKDSFTVLKDGQRLPGPIFIMEKMKTGFKPEFGDWRYSMILPDGSFLGETGGEGDQNMQYCGACHAAVPAEHDHMFYLPVQDRRKF
jgi:hypothetical protein